MYATLICIRPSSQLNQKVMHAGDLWRTKGKSCRGLRVVCHSDRPWLSEASVATSTLPAPTFTLPSPPVAHCYLPFTHRLHTIVDTHTIARPPCPSHRRASMGPSYSRSLLSGCVASKEQSSPPQHPRHPGCGVPVPAVDWASDHDADRCRPHSSCSAGPIGARSDRWRKTLLPCRWVFDNHLDPLCPG